MATDLPGITDIHSLPLLIKINVVLGCIGMLYLVSTAYLFWRNRYIADTSIRDIRLTMTGAGAAIAMNGFFIVSFVVLEPWGFAVAFMVSFFPYYLVTIKAI